MKSNGTVVATGFNDGGQCDVEEWTEIIAIKAGSRYTIGLRKDGTIVVAGDPEYTVAGFAMDLNRKEPEYSLYPFHETDEEGFVIVDNTGVAPDELCVLGYRNSLAMKSRTLISNQKVTV